MLENCIELTVLALYSHLKTIARMKIDENVFAMVEFLNKLAPCCEIKGENEISIYPLKKPFQGKSIKIEKMSGELAAVLCGMACVLKLAVKIEELTSEIDKKDLIALSSALNNTFVFSFTEKGFVFSSYTTQETLDFTEIENANICAGALIVLPLKEYDDKVILPNNSNRRIINFSAEKVNSFTDGCEIAENSVFVKSVYEKKFLKKRTGEPV